MTEAALVVSCHECALTQAVHPAEPGDVLACTRCGAHLRRLTRNGRARVLPLTLAAAIALVLTLCSPIVSVEVGGRGNSASLIGAALTLFTQGMSPLAALLILTTLAFPIFDLTVLAASALTIQLGSKPGRLTWAMQGMQLLRRWAMVEVFMLGVLVSIVRVAALAEIIPGLGLWALAAYLALSASAHVSFDDWDFWTRSGPAA